MHDSRWYARVITHGSLGLGESYVDGWWDCDDLDDMLYRILQARVDDHASRLDDAWLWSKAQVLNLQRGERSFTVGRRHYDLGNDLFRAMLGSQLIYSCGYWTSAERLDAALEANLDLVCRKLHFAPGMGETLKLAAERYSVEGVGVTISVEQVEYAPKLCWGLPIDIRVQDYRHLDELFHRILSIGMFEHVGVKYYPAYF